MSVLALAAFAFASSASATATLAQSPPTSGAPAPAALVMRERSLEVMSSPLELRAIGSDPAALDSALDAAFGELRRIEDLMTDWRASPLEDLNAAAGKGPQKMPSELLEIVQLALDVNALSDGAFDITFASVGKLWDFKAKPPRVPSDEALAAALKFVGSKHVTVDAKAGTIELAAGARIGLGGIAQGFGADRAMSVLMSHGVKHALVNVSGDIKALGTKFDRPWEIAIVHPRHKERVIAVIPVSNTCVVTSGDYERCFEVDGVRYHHILDPKTGRPSRGCMSATVMAPDAALADALATSLCVMGPEKGLAMIERLPRVEALVVDLEGNVRASKGLRTHLR